TGKVPHRREHSSTGWRRGRMWCRSRSRPLRLHRGRGKQTPPGQKLLRGRLAILSVHRQEQLARKKTRGHEYDFLLLIILRRLRSISELARAPLAKSVSS